VLIYINQQVNNLKKGDISLKKINSTLCLLISITVAQSNFNRFDGESLSYDVVWGKISVAEINTDIAFVNNNPDKMKVSIRSRTVGFARFIIEELDSIYTEFDPLSGQLIYSYRLSDWRFLGGRPDISEMTVTRDGQYITYRYEQTGHQPFQDLVVVDSNFSHTDLHDIATTMMFMRLGYFGVGNKYFFFVLGSTSNNLVPKEVPLLAEEQEILEINGVQYRVVKCSVFIADTSELFRDPSIEVWVTDDHYRVPVQVRVSVTVPILGKEEVNVILIPDKSKIPYLRPYIGALPNR